MKAFMCILLLALTIHDGYSMNEKQLKSAAKLIRNSCQPKSKVSDEQIENMHKGVWEDDGPAKCYMNCVTTMTKITKKTGEFDMDAVLKQIPTLPERYQEGTEKAMRTCSEKAETSSDKCEGSWNIAKCVYFESPENYFLP